MKMLSTFAVATFVFLAGCQSAGPRESAGGLLGAAAGGLIGAQFGSGKGQVAAAVVGALAGSALGGKTGRQLDREDRRRQATATEHAIHVPCRWPARLSEGYELICDTVANMP